MAACVLTAAGDSVRAKPSDTPEIKTQSSSPQPQLVIPGSCPWGWHLLPADAPKASEMSARPDPKPTGTGTTWCCWLAGSGCLGPFVWSRLSSVCLHEGLAGSPCCKPLLNTQNVLS